MGFKLAELFVSVNADDTPLNRTLAAIRGKLEKLATTKLTIPGGGFGAILGLGGAGLGLKSVIDDAVTMESKMATLAKATDLEGAALASMKSELLRLSVAIKGVRINDLLDIATAGAKLGVAAGDLPAYAEGVAKVASAMDDIPAGVIAEEIGKLNSVFKLGVQGTLQFGSAIDKVADSGVSSAKNILDVTQRISGTAVAARLTAQESIALAGALLDTGTNAEAGATALQRLIQALNSPDLKDRQNFAKVLNVDMGTLAKTIKDRPIEAIRQFLAAVKGLDAQSQQRAIASIGIENIHGLGEIQKLAQQVGTLERYVGMANHEFGTLDQITKSYAASAATTKAQIATMENQLQILGDRIGSSLLPAVNSGLTLIGDLGTGLGDMWAKAAEGVRSWGRTSPGSSTPSASACETWPTSSNWQARTSAAGPRISPKSWDTSGRLPGRPPAISGSRSSRRCR
jgi:TP901 family phage tail tape measure protein